jgi:exopolysaccharide biosynthesis protein
VAATRSAAGVADRGHILLLLALDGSAESGTGLTLRELAGLLAALGASDGVDLDGGGSSTLVTRSALTGRPVVRNHPSGGAQRPVANAVGVFAAGF